MRYHRLRHGASLSSGYAGSFEIGLNIEKDPQAAVEREKEGEREVHMRDEGWSLWTWEDVGQLGYMFKWAY